MGWSGGVPATPAIELAARDNDEEHAMSEMGPGCVKTPLRPDFPQDTDDFENL